MLKKLLISFFLFNSILSESDKVVVGYYVPWGKLAPESIPYKKLTHINYGFGVLVDRKDPAKITIDRYYDGNKIRKIKQLAAQQNVKVLISLGGWTGSQTFSLVAKEPELRKKFIQNALLFLRKNTKPEWETEPSGWDLDGIDIDWEYPGRLGAKCNEISPDDSKNYLTLLKELREAMDLEFPDQKKLLTAAVRAEPFDGPDEKPLKDVSKYSNYFDFINIMAYDIMGSWSNTTGPNAPFKTNSKQGPHPYSFTQSINSWLDAGFPPNKIAPGLAFYGRSSTAQANMNHESDSQYVPKHSAVPKGDESDSNDVNFYCNEGSVYSGVYKYKFIRQDILSGGHDAAPVKGYHRHWDAVSQTPWLFHPETHHFISYDDPKSIKIKVDYAKEMNLRGVMFWDISHDINEELLDVTQSVRTASSSKVTKISRTSPRYHQAYHHHHHHDVSN